MFAAHEHTMPKSEFEQASPPTTDLLFRPLRSGLRCA